MSGDFKLDFRTVKRRDKNGNLKSWTSKTYYITYYENRKRKWINTEKTDYSEAEDVLKEKEAVLKGGTVYQFLKSNLWLDELKNPLYVGYANETTNYHLHYAHSRKNVRYLQIILEEIKDPIRDLIFYKVSRSDVEAFKERLARMTKYVDGHNHERDITNTFRNRVLFAFSTIWSYYLRKGDKKLDSNPFLMVEKFKKNKEPKKKFVFSPEIYRFLFDREILEELEPLSSYSTKRGNVVKKLTKEKWEEIIYSVWIDFFEFVFLTGLRGSEAAAVCVKQFANPKDYNYRVLDVNRAFKAGLRKDIVNSNNGSVEIIGNTKTEETRTIVLCDRAYEIAMKYIKGKSDDDLLFTLPMEGKNNVYSTYLLSQKRADVFNIFINEMNEQFGFCENDTEVLSLHGFRSSLNSVLLGVPYLNENLVAYTMGWASKSISFVQRKHYTYHDRVMDLIQVANQINLLYLGKPLDWKPLSVEQKENKFEKRKAEILNKNRKTIWIRELKDIFMTFMNRLRNGEFDYTLTEEEKELAKNSIEQFLAYDVSTLKKWSLSNFHEALFATDEAVRIFESDKKFTVAVMECLDEYKEEWDWDWQ